MSKSVDMIERGIYALICKNDGIKARDIAKQLQVDRKVVNHYLYASPYMHDLCYRDSDYLWHGLIRQTIPHVGLGDYSGYYGTVREFLELDEEEWLERLQEGCRNIGRNLNDTRGLFHSFKDARETMRGLFEDLAQATSGASAGGGESNHKDRQSKVGSEKFSRGSIQTKAGSENPNHEAIQFENWGIVFELRIKRSRMIRIYADVLVITENKVFSLEFKMKDIIEPEEVAQAAKYTSYIEVLFGPDYDVIPALVLTKATDLYQYAPLPGTAAEIPVCSGDMLFNVFDEYIGFLE